MTKSGERRTIRRILVAVDASPHSYAALQAAAEIAAGVDAELVGLFVEDENLVRLSRSSRAREVSLHSAERSRLDPRAVEEMFQQMAARAREFLHRVSQQESVRDVSFRTTRGQVAPRLLEAAVEADLLTVGARGWTPGTSPGSTVRSLVRASEAPPVMVLREGARLGTCPFAIYDGTDAGREAVRLAAYLAAPNDARVTVLVPTGPEREDVEALAREAEARLAETGVGGSIRELSPDRASRLAAFLRRRECGVLVAPRPVGETLDHVVHQLLTRADCPVLLVR